MSQMPYPPMQYPPPPQQHGNAGTASLALGLVGLFFSFIPLVGFIGVPLVILGLVFGITGLRSRTLVQDRGLCIAGVVVSALGLMLSLLYGAIILLSVSA